MRNQNLEINCYLLLSSILFFCFLQRIVSSSTPLLSSVAASSASSTTAVCWSPPPLPLLPPSPRTSSWKMVLQRARGFAAPRWGSRRLKRAPPPRTETTRPTKAIRARLRLQPSSASSRTRCRTTSSQALSIIIIISSSWQHIWRRTSVPRRSPALGCPL